MPYQQLTLNERYHIQILRQQQQSICAIARAIGRHKSTISRELRRFNGKEYLASAAQQQTDVRRAAATKATKFSTMLMATIRAMLPHWTPAIIAGRLAIEGAPYRASHETIYRYIYADKQSGGTLYQQLPRKGRRYKYERNGGECRGKLSNRKSIHERPDGASNRSESGHYEGDTVHGKHGSLLTLVDRKHRFALIRGIKDRQAETVCSALTALTKAYPMQSLTVDNGKEFAHHERFGTDVYFADPYRSSQRGSNEQLNGLIRRRYPKGVSFGQVSEEDLRQLEMTLNLTPRKCLNWLTPFESFYDQRVALIV